MWFGLDQEKRTAVSLTRLLEREKIRLTDDSGSCSVYFTVLGKFASLSAAIAPSESNLSGSMVQVAVLLGKSTLTSVTPSRPASVSRTTPPQAVAHCMLVTSNETWLAVVSGVVEFDSVSSPPQPTLRAVTAKSIKRNRMISCSLLKIASLNDLLRLSRDHLISLRPCFHQEQIGCNGLR